MSADLHVSTHAIQRWRERLGTDGHDRIVRKLRAIVSKGRVCWPKAKRIAKHGTRSTYFRHGEWVVVVQDATICTVIPWRFDEWRKTPPKGVADSDSGV